MDLFEQELTITRNYLTEVGKFFSEKEIGCVHNCMQAFSLDLPSRKIGASSAQLLKDALRDIRKLELPPTKKGFASEVIFHLEKLQQLQTFHTQGG